MSDRNAKHPAGGPGAAKTEDLIALAGREETTAPAVIRQAPKLEEYRFDWENSEHVIVWEQPRTAVHFNTRGQTVIKQMAEYPEEDVFLLFNRESLPELIRKLAAHIDCGNEGRTWEAINTALCDLDL